MTSLTFESSPARPAPPRGEKFLWSTGPLLAITAHVLVLAYLLHTPTPVPAVVQSPAAAPVVITMAVMPTTSQRASQESVAQQASEPETPTPPPEPAKLDVAEKEVKTAEVKAQVRDTKQQPKTEPKPEASHTAKPRPEKPLPKKVEVKKPAPETTQESARSNSIEQLAQKNQAPQVGAASNQAASAQQSWQSMILAQLQREKRYPNYALRMKQQDTVIVRFTIDRNGNVLATRIEKSKGYASLDRESLQLLERASPLPKPPSSAFINSDKLELVVPVSFMIRDV